MFSGERDLAHLYLQKGLFNMSYPESEEHPISQILTVDNRQLEIRRFGDNEKYVAFTFSKKDLPLQVFNGDPNNPMVVDQEDIDAI